MFSKAQWDREKMLELIDYYHKSPILWNREHIEFRNKSKKSQVIVNIATCLKVDPLEVNKKLHTLRLKLNSEMKKYRESRYCNDKSVWQSGWEFFEKLTFITTSPKYRGPGCKTPAQTAEMQIRLIDRQLLTKPSPTLPAQQAAQLKPEDDESKVTSSTILKRKISTVNNNNKSTQTGGISEYQVSVDDHIAFGNFITSELRQIESGIKRTRLRLLIQKTLIAVAEERPNLEQDNEIQMLENNEEVINISDDFEMNNRNNLDPGVVDLNQRRNVSIDEVSITSNETVLFTPRAHRSGNIYGPNSVICPTEQENRAGCSIGSNDSINNADQQPTKNYQWINCEPGATVKQEYYE